MNLSIYLERSGPLDPWAVPYRDARRTADAFYQGHGRKAAPARLLSQTGKLQHSEGFAVGLQLRPGDASGLEVCTWRTAGCTAACVLETSFRGNADGVRDGRTLRTLFLSEHPAAFLSIIARELETLAATHGRVAFRPNIASDLRWERIAPSLFSIPGVAGYDYTKADPMRHRDALANYRLVYSVSERPVSEAIGHAYVLAGGTSAVVVRAPKHAVPSTWRGLPAVDGDASDDRTLDPAGVYVLLASKADGRHDRTGFVKDPATGKEG